MKALFVLISLILAGCGKRQDFESTESLPVSKPSISRSSLLFEYQDSAFDDRGSGFYVYPVPLQTAKEGIFDMSTFTVKDTGNTVDFLVEFRRPIDGHDLSGKTYSKGFAFQLIDIYIDTNHTKNEGLIRGLPGRNLEFNPEEAWDKVVVLTPASSREVENYFAEKSEDRELYLARKDIIAPEDVYVAGYTLRARVRKSLIGEPQETWGYQVCVMGFNPNNLKRNGLLNAEVATFATAENFGGGTDYEGNSNVIDILSPAKESQYSVLSKYVSEPFAGKNLYPILPMIYGKDKQNPPQIRKKSENSEIVPDKTPILAEPETEPVVKPVPVKKVQPQTVKSKAVGRNQNKNQRKNAEDRYRTPANKDEQ